MFEKLKKLFKKKEQKVTTPLSPSASFPVGSANTSISSGTAIQNYPSSSNRNTEDFNTSYFIGMATGSAALGYVTGGSIAGAVLGEVTSSYNEDTSSLSNSSSCSNDNNTSYDYSSSSSSDYSSNSYDSCSSSSSDSYSSSYDSGSSW